MNDTVGRAELGWAQAVTDAIKTNSQTHADFTDVLKRLVDLCGALAQRLDRLEDDLYGITNRVDAIEAIPDDD